MAVLVDFAGSGVEGDEDVLARPVAGLFDGLKNYFYSLLVALETSKSCEVRLFAKQARSIGRAQSKESRPQAWVRLGLLFCARLLPATGKSTTKTRRDEGTRRMGFRISDSNLSRPSPVTRVFNPCGCSASAKNLRPHFANPLRRK